MIDRYTYLQGLLQNKDDLKAIKLIEPEGANTLVIVYELAFDGFQLKQDPVSTEELIYCGLFNHKIITS